MLINEIPFEEILEARNGPFDKAWRAIFNQDWEALQDRETAAQLLGAQNYLHQLITDYVPSSLRNEDKTHIGTCIVLTMMALNILTGWREQQDEDAGEEFNDCENYDDPFAPEWDDEDEKPAKEIWSKR